MKKFLAILLTCSLVLASLTACGGKSGDGGSNGGNEGNNGSSGNQSQNEAEHGIVETGGSITYSPDDAGINKSAKVDIGSLYVTDSMLDTGIARPGSLERLAAVMEKASFGQGVTIAYVGGGTAAGKGASSYEKSYAALTTAWLKETFPNAAVNEINIGALNCDSYVAVHRVSEEVIKSSPDIVILDTAYDDTGAICEEAFESMVRAFLSGTSAAVIPLITTDSTYAGNGDKQSALAFKLDLPVISYLNVLKANVTNGTWTWNDVATAEDTVYPADSGHAFIAYLLTGYFGRVLEGISSSSYKEYVLTDSTTTKARYNNGAFVGPASVPHDGEDNALTSLPGVDSYSFVSQGMGTQNGNEATFDVTGKNIGMLYWRSTDGNGGSFDVYVDDVLITTLSADLSEDENATYSFAECVELGKYDESGTHKVKLVKNSESEADDFYVCGFLVS